MSARLQQLTPADGSTALEARTPVLLHGSAGHWRVAAGFVDVFAVRLDGEEPAGRRLFVLRLEEGEAFSALPAATDHGLLAVGGQGSELEPLPPETASASQWLERLRVGLGAEAHDDEAVTPGHVQAWLAARFARYSADAQQAVERRRLLARELEARGVRELARTLAPDDDRQAGASPQAEDPLMPCLRAVAEAVGAEIRVPPERPTGDSHTRARALLAASDLRGRQVLLRGRWWCEDHGPLLAWDTDGHPVALLRDRSGYQCLDPRTGARQRANAQLASTLQAEAVMVYPCLPEAPQSLWDLVRFAGRGAGGDLVRIASYGLAGALLGVLVPVLTGILVDDILPSGDRGQLLMLALLVLGVSAGSVAFSIVRSFARLRLEARADVRVQTGLFDRMLRLPQAYLRRYTAGDLADRLLGMQRAREQLSGATLSAIISMVFSITSLLVLFVYSWQLALVAILLASVYIAVVLRLVWKQLGHERWQAEARGRVQGFNTQMLVGISKLRVAHAEGRAFNAWAERFANQMRHFLDSGRIANRLGVFQALFAPLSTAMVMMGVVMLDDHLRLFGGTGLTALAAPGQGGGVTAGMFVAFSAAFTQFLGGARGGVEALSNGLGAIPQIERAAPLLQSPVESRRGRLDPGRLAGEVGLNNVSFRYEQDGPLVLDRVSFNVEAGSFVAIVGPSGSGKSTVQRLIMGFEEPVEGEVRFDDQALAGLDRSAVRRQLGVVLQSGTLPGGALHEIILGESNGTMADAWAAARQAGLEADIRAMPMQLHTVMQDGATTLSGGQRQRLAIARALARRPRILLLDEATSALDNAAQALVSRTLAELGITRILVAHRLSTIRDADRILVIDAGRLVETGTFDELLARGGVFAALAARQLL